MDSKKRLEKEFRQIDDVLDKIKVVKNNKLAEEFLDTAKRYRADAEYFANKKDLMGAFGALNYAFGWMDAGLKIGIFELK